MLHSIRRMRTVLTGLSRLNVKWVLTRSHFAGNIRDYNAGIARAISAFPLRIHHVILPLSNDSLPKFASRSYAHAVGMHVALRMREDGEVHRGVKTAHMRLSCPDSTNEFHDAARRKNPQPSPKHTPEFPYLSSNPGGDSQIDGTRRRGPETLRQNTSK